MRRWLLLALVGGLVAGAVIVGRGDVPCDVLAAQPTCYVALRPGPAEDAVGLVSIAGAPSYAPAGELLLTTVAVDDELGFVDWLRASTSGNVDAVPRDQVFPPGIDRDDVAEQNAALMADSQLTATLVALNELGYDVRGDGALVAAVSADAVTDVLEEGDVIVSVAGESVADSGAVVDAVRAHAPGDRIEVEVTREGARQELELTLGRSPDDPQRAYIGVLLTTEVDLPVDVQIDAGVIGGPSAGLMFALSIVELLEPGELTGGAVVAGTGTVDRDGTVGSVGGVRQKVVGATMRSSEDRPATVFLVPRNNLAEARVAPVDREVLLVPVDTLGDALLALDDLREGRRPLDALALSPTAVGS